MSGLCGSPNSLSSYEANLMDAFATQFSPPKTLQVSTSIVNCYEGNEPSNCSYTQGSTPGNDTMPQMPNFFATSQIASSPGIAAPFAFRNNNNDNSYDSGSGAQGDQVSMRNTTWTAIKPDRFHALQNAMINASRQNQTDADNSRYDFANSASHDPAAFATPATTISQYIQGSQTTALPYTQSHQYQSNSSTNALNGDFVFNQGSSNHNFNQSVLLPYATPTTFNTQFPILQPRSHPEMTHNIHPVISTEMAASLAHNQGNEKTTSEEGSATVTSNFNAPLLHPSKAKKRTSTPKPTFVLKLMQVLSMEECQCAIQWMPAGNSFCILNAKDLVEKVLSKHFKETKYSSFVRIQRPFVVRAND